MKVVFSNEQLRHSPRRMVSSGALVDALETPARAERLLSAALAAGLDAEAPPDYGIEPLAAVHSPEYLAFLERIFARWQHIDGASEDVLPNVHPNARGFVYPASAVGQAGWHVYDGSCPVTADTWDSACWSANAAIHGARELLAGAHACYALARPPGHHAARDVVGGFCYLNNGAIAAEVLRSGHERVAVLDVDVHHGNGTQDIFYARRDVLTVSLHADPVRFYPFFWGAAAETGDGAGAGYNLNVPLPRGTDDAAYLAALEPALEHIDAFEPGALVVALGLDAYEGDPSAGFAITTGGFGRIAERIAALGLPTLLVQEGGYAVGALGANLTAVLEAFRR